MTAQIARLGTVLLTILLYQFKFARESIQISARAQTFNTVPPRVISINKLTILHHLMYNSSINKS